MIQHFKRLGSQIFYYGLGNVITKFIAILTLPIFSYYLSPADFGVASILTISTVFVSGLVDFGLTISIFRFYSEKSINQKKLLSMAQTLPAIAGVIIVVLVVIFSHNVSQILFNTTNYSYILSLAFLANPLNDIARVPLNRLKIENKVKLFSFIRISKIFTDLVLKVVLVIFLHRGLNGFFEAQLINAFVYALFFIFYSYRKIGFGFSWSLLRKMIHFSLPFVFSPIFFWALDWSDRFLLGRMTNLTEVGLYSLGYNIGMGVLLPVSSFITAWPAFYMSVTKDPKMKKFISLVLTYFFLIVGFFILSIMTLSRDYFRLLTPLAFHQAYDIVPMIVFSYAFLGFYSIILTGTYIKRKTLYIFLTEILAVAINITLMFILIPKFGRLGAAIATLISYISLPVLIYSFTFKIFPVQYEYKRLAQILIVILGLFWLCQKIYSPSYWNLFLRILIILAYPVILWLIGFFEKNEINILKTMFKKYYQRKSIINEV